MCQNSKSEDLEDVFQILKRICLMFKNTLENICLLCCYTGHDWQWKNQCEGKLLAKKYFQFVYD